MKTTIGKFALTLIFCICFSNLIFSQKKLKEGHITFEIVSTDQKDNSETSVSTITFTFNNLKKSLDVYSFLFQYKIIVERNSLSESRIQVNLFGTKNEITELSEKDIYFAPFLSLDSIETIEYFKKKTKIIAGYKCYRAVITKNNGDKQELFITEKLKSLVPEITTFDIKGFPLEIKPLVPEEKVTTCIKLKELNSKIPEDAFQIPEDYEKISMEEYNKKR